MIAKNQTILAAKGGISTFPEALYFTKFIKLLRNFNREKHLETYPKPIEAQGPACWPIVGRREKNRKNRERIEWNMVVNLLLSPETKQEFNMHHHITAINSTDILTLRDNPLSDIRQEIMRL